MNAPWVNNRIGGEFVSGQLQGKTWQSVQKLLELHLRQEPSAKVQSRIIPFIFVVMMIAFLDRINIGFAA